MSNRMLTPEEISKDILECAKSSVKAIIPDEPGQEEGTLSLRQNNALAIVLKMYFAKM